MREEMILKKYIVFEERVQEIRVIIYIVLVIHPSLRAARKTFRVFYGDIKVIHNELYQNISPITPRSCLLGREKY